MTKYKPDFTSPLYGKMVLDISKRTYGVLYGSTFYDKHDRKTFTNEIEANLFADEKIEQGYDVILDYKRSNLRT